MDPTAADTPNPQIGARMADGAARLLGSWIFVALVAAFIAGWVLLNMTLLLQSGHEPSDPRPYLLLDLILSALAALSAPVILMALVGQARREKLRAEYDAVMRRKVEQEIRTLHERIDAIRDRELADILAHQIELLQELRDRPRSNTAA